MAAENLLFHAHNVRAGAIRITDAIGFDWPRWMDNIVQGHELRGPGVAEAYVVRRALKEEPEYVFVRMDGVTVAITPRSQMHAAAQRQHGINLISEEDEAVCMLLRDASVAVQQWQRLRRPPPQQE